MSQISIPIDLSKFDVDTPQYQVLHELGLSVVLPAEIAEQGEAIEALRSTLHYVTAQAGKALRDLAEAREARRIDNERYASFCEQVRQKAKDAADEQGWCRPGLNAALQDLGLDPFIEHYRVTATITAVFEVTGSEDVETEDQAAQRVGSALDGVEYSGFGDVDLARWEVAAVDAHATSNGE
jgi:hypothetical protein